MSTESLATAPAPAAPATPAPQQQTAPSPAAPVTPGSKAWAEMSPEARYAQLRGPDNPRSRGHSPARDHREAVAAQATGQDAPPADPSGEPQAPPEAPADGTKFKVGKFEVSEGDLAAMLERQSLEDLRAATRPAAPEGYEAKLPADLKLPGGMAYTFDQNDPSLVAARNLAHAKGWSQQDFSEALGIFASHHAQQEAALAERSRQEIEKIGVNGPQRADAVAKWIVGMVGAKDGAPICATLVTDAHLRFYEAIIGKLTSQGAAGFSQSHRVPPETNAIPGYDKMSFEQRRQAQDSLAARRR
jgi:hypothetical protein